MGLCLLIIFSCDELEPTILVEGNNVEVVFEVLPTNNIGYQTFSESTSKINLDSILGSNNSTIEDITNIQITGITIYVLNKDSSINLNIFDTVEATMRTENNPEIIIGYQDVIPLNVQELNCNYSSDNLLDYLSNTIVYLKAKGVNNSNITDTIWIKGIIETKVNRRIL